MPFNLIIDAWLPVRRHSGVCAIVAAGDLTSSFDDDPITALNFPRPDWNAAVSEWLIGLTFLAFRPEDDDGWAERFLEPPNVSALRDAYAPFAFAFNLNGEGPLAFQDFDDLIEVEPRSISSLLIDAPGENTLKNNADLFVKRGGAEALSAPYAAAALITLQTYAPSGGAGHRTSMRGGGPLTTLIVPRRRGRSGGVVQTLWDKIYANLPGAGFDPAAPDPRTPRSASSWARTFPWLTCARTSRNDVGTSPEDATPAQAFFATPRRIRLIFNSDVTPCDLGGDPAEAAIGLRTINYGVNYVGWTHPLSPYRLDKKAGMLPIHAQAGAVNYGDYAAWWGMDGAPARGVADWSERRRLVSALLVGDGIEAVGFDMDNMKARQWIESRFPWLPVIGRESEALKSLTVQCLDAANEAARAVRYAVKIALYGQRQQEGGYRLPETLPRDALPEPGEALFRETAGAFILLIDELVNAAKTRDAGRDLSIKTLWVGELRCAANRLFTEFVDIDGLCETNPHRVLRARDGLSWAFATKGAVAKALKIQLKTSSTDKETA